MTPEQIDSKLADHDRWFAEMRELTAANASAIKETRALADSNARVIQSLCDLAAEDRQERQQISAEIAEIQSEVRGMQTENRRILDILLNQNQQNTDNN
jgi:hypothetical protein